MTQPNKKTSELTFNKKIKKLIIPIVGLILILVISIAFISLNPELIKNISKKTNMAPSSATGQNNTKAEIKKTTYSYGDFPNFQLAYPTDWQVGSISTKQFSLSKAETKAVITLEVPSVSGLTNITCNTNTVKISDKVTRVLPIGRTDYIYFPSSSIHLKDSQKYNDIIKSADLSKSSPGEKQDYAQADSCGAELYTSLTKTKLRPNDGINSPDGQGWFRVTASSKNPEQLKELDKIISEIGGLYWE